MKGFNKKVVRKAIEGSGGIMATIAKRLNCKWDTAKKYVDKYDLWDEIENEKNTMLDLAETKLLQNIQANDNTSIIFYLKTQGKERGYVESHDIRFGKDAVINVRHLEDEE